MRQSHGCPSSVPRPLPYSLYQAVEEGATNKDGAKKTGVAGSKCYMNSSWNGLNASHENPGLPVVCSLLLYREAKGNYIRSLALVPNVASQRENEPPGPQHEPLSQYDPPHALV